MRKFVQIETSVSPETIKDHSCIYVTGLCNDGTVWLNIKPLTGEGEWSDWERLPDVSQGDE